MKPPLAGVPQCPHGENLDAAQGLVLTHLVLEHQRHSQRLRQSLRRPRDADFPPPPSITATLAYLDAVKAVRINRCRQGPRATAKTKINDISVKTALIRPFVCSSTTCISFSEDTHPKIEGELELLRGGDSNEGNKVADKLADRPAPGRGSRMPASISARQARRSSIRVSILGTTAQLRTLYTPPRRPS